MLTPWLTFSEPFHIGAYPHTACPRQLNRRPTTTVTNTASGLLFSTYCAGCLTVRLCSFTLVSIRFHSCYSTPGSSPNSFFRHALYDFLRSPFAHYNPSVVSSCMSHSDRNIHGSLDPFTSVNTASNDSKTTNVPLQILYYTSHPPEALVKRDTGKTKVATHRASRFCDG